MNKTNVFGNQDGEGPPFSGRKASTDPQLLYQKPLRLKHGVKLNHT